MITIQSGKLIIPEDERFVGFAGDNAAVTRQFLLKDRAEEGCTYSLCLRFDDDTAAVVPLSAVISGADTVLTWEVGREDIRRTGIVMAQIRIADSDGDITHTTRDYFMVGASAETDDDGSDIEYITRSELDRALRSAAATAPYVGDDGYWYVYDADEQGYKKTSYHISGYQVDDQMSGVSDNPVSNREIKRYVDAAASAAAAATASAASACNVYAAAYADAIASGMVPDTLKIAGIPLSGDISASDLMNSIYRQVFISLVVPGSTRGYIAQYGLDGQDHPVVCIMGNEWERIATYSELTTGLAGVYSKSEIDAMLGSIETLLASV